ncbi:helix-turn-helix domain-containing protein [Filifactor alocis]|uniref:helix-turn-helix domain-containing protein n=1 Tax=Filifactor alocis TaxID=143361 RepID=UPI003FA0ABB5
MIKIHLSKILGEKRITQKELADKTGIRPATIHEIYHELIDRINLEHLNKICKVLNIKVEDVLEYTPDKNSKF